ncbi:MAG TPA: squalene synthase HpnC [bacterium]|nr:squalene synthase HpnC [bacterium]
MKNSIPPALVPAYQECLKIATRHYENFPVASLLLSKGSRLHIAALYAFARTADDFADEDSYEGRRVQELNRWEKSLKAALGGKPAPPALRAFAHTLQTFQIPAHLPLNLLRAFRMDIVQHRWSTWNSLLYYCRHSANPVGRMVLYISGIRDEKLHRLSDFICGGLQLINFWQDTSVDLDRGRIYYPKSEWKKTKIREKDLLAGKDTSATRQLVRNAVDFTERYFQQGLPLLEKVPGRLRLELRATYHGGMGILKKIRMMDYNVLENRPQLGNLDKLLIFFTAIAPKWAQGGDR